MKIPKLLPRGQPRLCPHQFWLSLFFSILFLLLLCFWLDDTISSAPRESDLCINWLNTPQYSSSNSSTAGSKKIGSELPYLSPPQPVPSWLEYQHNRSSSLQENGERRQWPHWQAESCGHSLLDDTDLLQIGAMLDLLTMLGVVLLDALLLIIVYSLLTFVVSVAIVVLVAQILIVFHLVPILQMTSIVI